MLELHDSVLASVTMRDSVAELALEPACIHRSDGVPGTDTGTVWLQNCKIQLDGASLPWFESLSPTRISDGLLIVGRRRYRNSLPIEPQRGSIQLRLTLETGQTVKIIAERFCLVPSGQPRYLEEFPGV